jgi:hypothetical protein
MPSQKPELPDDNPRPTSPDYEAFHVTANKEESQRLVRLLAEAGIRLNETVWNQIGHHEYVIEVHQDDIERAGEAFWRDIGPVKTFTSTNTEIHEDGDSESTR